MTGLILKLIACVTMFIDHSAAMLLQAGVLPFGTFYTVLRCIGRLAFPIYCFLLCEGCKYTKRKWVYLLRMAVLAAVSEIPFNLSLFGSVLDPAHQNVFLTLALGVPVVYVIQWAGKQVGKLQFPAFLLALLTTGAAGVLAEKVLFTDYGWAGIYMIAIMGIYSSPLYKIRFKMMNQEGVLRLLFCGVGIMVCCLVSGSQLEYFALLSLIPIYFYNGKRGFSSKVLQYGFYFFYPVHLMLLGLIYLALRGI